MWHNYKHSSVYLHIFPWVVKIKTPFEAGLPRQKENKMLKWFKFVCPLILILALLSPMYAQNCGDTWPLGLFPVTPGQWWFLQDQYHPNHYLLVSVRNYVQDDQGRTVCPVIVQKYPDANDYWQPGQNVHLHDYFLYDASHNLWQVQYNHYTGISDNGGTSEGAITFSADVHQPGNVAAPSDLIMSYYNGSAGYSTGYYYQFNNSSCSTGNDQTFQPCGWWPVSFYTDWMPSNAPTASGAQLLCSQFSEGVNPNDANTQTNPLVNGTPKPGTNVGYTDGKNNAETWCFGTQGQGLFRLTNNQLHFCWYNNLSECPPSLVDSANGNFDVSSTLGDFREDFLVVSFTSGGYVLGSGPYPYQFGLTP